MCIFEGYDLEDFRIIESACKHGISEEDIRYACKYAVSTLTLQDIPEKVMVFGFDTAGRALEIGYFVTDQKIKVIMHAMRIRKIYEKYLG